MSQIPNLSFDVRFEPHNPNRVGLIDTTPSLPAGYIGIFKVTQPDGYVRNGDINNPDVNSVTRGVSVTLVPDAAGQLQQGQYVIELTALAPGYLSTTFTRTFTFQYTPATVVLRNDFDLFTPSLAYTDISNYNVSGYNISSGPERKWDVTSPTTGLISGTNSSIDLVYNGNYYAENYSIAFRVNIAYVSQAYAWLSITHTINTTAAVTACIPKSIEELTQAVDALRIESNQACGDDWSRFEKANALYTHLINMLRLVLVAGEYQEGFHDVYQQLLSLLQNGNTTCSTVGQIIPPYDFSDYESSIYDGEASYCTLIGNGVDTVYTVNHQLGDKCVVAQVYEVATGKQVICDLAVVTINSIDITFFEPPTTNQYRVVVVAGVIGLRGQGLQPGGLEGQVLVKKSDADFDTEWADASIVNPLFVPYIGATSDVDLGEFGLKTGNIEFDTTPTGAPTTAGSAVWNDSDGTVDLVLKGGNTTIQLGQDLVVRVVNKTNANLLRSEYKAVRVRKVSEGGAQGQRLAVVLGQGSTEMNSTDMLGIVTENIANNNEGFITTFGTVRGINTTGSLQGEVWADGDILFLSPTVPGGITKVKPSAPNHLVIIGYVEYAHQNNGKIFVHVQTSWELDELHNVQISSPVYGQVLKYNQGLNLWQNDKLSIEELYDVFINNPSPGQILSYTGGGWNNINIPASVTSVGLATTTSGITITNTPVTGSGVININIATASGSTNGLLSSTDWTAFNGKQAFITPGTTAQYYRGDKTFQNLDTSVVPESTNLYFTDSRARQAISLTTIGGSGAATYDNSTGIINVPQYTIGSLGGVPSTRTLTINGTAYDLSSDRSWSVGTVTSVDMSVPTGFAIGGNPVTSSGTLALSFASGYSLPTDASQANWNTAYTNRITSLTTTGTSGAATLVSNVLNIPQYQAQGNYITSLTGEATASGPGAASVTLSNSAVTGKVLTGLTVTGTTIAATDSILTAFGKVQGQINSLMGGLKYQGTWNASTNTPALASGTGTEGHFYIVNVAGTTSIDGINDWKIGDWIVYNGGVWQKVDNTDSVVSVNGATGAVVLTTTNISEGTNLYYTDARARLALSLTTTGSSGAATYDNITGVFNIPQYTLAGLGGVPTTRQLTINGTAFDLSADRSWSVGTVTSVAALTIGSTGTDVNSTVSNGTTTPAITLNIPSASTTARGLVTTSAQTFGGDKTFYSNATILDTANSASQLQGKAGGVLYGGIFFGPFYQFNAYAGATEGYIWKNAATDNVMTLSQTGAFSLKTLIGTGTRMVVTDANGLVSTQAIPSGTTTGSGTTNYIPKWTPNGTTLGNSAIFETGNNTVIGSATAQTGFERTLQLHSSNTGADVRLIFSDATTGQTMPSGFHILKAAQQDGFLYNYSNAGIIFGTNATERMRIFANGNVAIGTTTDSGYKLDVAGTLRSTLGANFATTSGNVGIGTASPDHKLDITAANISSGYGGVNIRDVSADRIRIGYTSSSAPVAGLVAAQVLAASVESNGGLMLATRGNVQAGMSFYTSPDAGVTGLVERIRISSAGNVGIGTTSPNSNFRLTINSGTNTNSFYSGSKVSFSRTSDNAADIVYLSRTNDLGSNGTANIHGYDGIQFRTQGPETVKAIITGAGNVGIGTASPNTRLHVVGDGTVGPMSLFGGARAGALGIKVYNETTAQSSIITLGEESGTSSTPFFIRRYGSTNASANVVEFNQTQNAAMLFYTNNTERARIAADGTIAASSLSGTGTRMVVADSSGVLSTQSISGGVVLGSGTTNYVPKWTSSSGLGNSQIFDNGTNVGIGTTSPTFKFVVSHAANNWSGAFIAPSSNELQFSGNITNNNNGPSIRAVTSGGAAYTSLTIDGSYLDFKISGLSQQRIFSTGNMFVGPSPADSGYRLDVNGTTSVRNGKIDVIANTDFAMNLNRTGTSPVAFQAFTSNAWIIMGAESSSGGGLFTGSSANAAVVGSGYNTPLQFATNNIVRMTVNNVGSVGIGTSSPVNELEVYGNNQPRFSIRAAESILESLELGFQFGTGANSSTNTLGLIRAIPTQVDPNPLIADLAFSTNSGDSNTEKMRITGAGNVGIGTAGPAGKLDVYDGSSSSLYVRSATAGANWATGTSSQIGTYTNHPFYLKANDNTAITILGSGNVGIGTTNPTGYQSRIVNVFGSTGAEIHLTTTGTGTAASDGLTLELRDSDGNGTLMHRESASLVFGTSDIERMRIFPTGNVFVGASPADSGYKLDVNGTARFQDTITTRSGTAVGIQMASTSAIRNVGTQYHDFGTGGSGDFRIRGGSGFGDYFTILNSGNVGVGTLSPASLLHVNASATGGGAIFSRQGYNYATVSQLGSSTDAIFGGGVIASSVNGEMVKTVADAANYMKLQLTDGISFHTGITGAVGTAVPRLTNLRMIINSSGDVGVGTSSPSFKLDVNGTFNVRSNYAYFGGDANTAVYLGSFSNEGRIGVGGRSSFPTAALTFYTADGTNNFERMRITSAGEVLVGTTTDSGDYKLQVNGGIYTNYQMKVAAAQLSIDGYSNGAALYIASHSVTGSSNQPVIQADVTLNTTGDVNLLNYSITNTASGANTNWLRMSDGTNTFRVTKGAAVVTAAPTGGSAKPWKLGSVVATTVALNTGNFVEVEIDGTFYRLAIVNPA